MCTLASSNSDPECKCPADTKTGYLPNSRRYIAGTADTDQGYYTLKDCYLDITNTNDLVG